MTRELSDYTSRTAGASVLLHEKHLRECVEVWKQAKSMNLDLPDTDNEAYRSLEALLAHLFGSARSYLVWICRQLQLPDPAIRPAPAATGIDAEADGYLEHLLERWRLPLADLEDEKLYFPEYPTTLGTHHHCIDIMLEHAVIHPIRHEFQLRELMSRPKR